MLTTLRIKNLALVADLTLELAPGYNAISGETGAGKSVIIGALNLVLGERADRGLIRSGAESCSVEAVFDAGKVPRDVDRFLEERGLERCEEGQLVLKRAFTAAGANRQFVNGSPASLAVLAELGEWLVDMHGPHDHQSLLHPARQLEILDAYGELGGLRSRFEALRAGREAILKRKANLVVDERAYAQQVDLLRFQANEIAAAKLALGEDAQVEGEYARASNAARLLDLAQQALGALAEGDDALLDRLGAVGRSLQELARIDSSAAGIVELQEGAANSLRELQRELSRYADGVEIDPARLHELEQRLNLLQGLKRKYGNTVDEVIAFGNEAREKLAALESRDAELARLNEELRANEGAIWQAGQELTAARKKVIPKLAKAAVKELGELGFKQSSLTIEIRTARREEAFANLGWTGFDTIEFLFAPNPGEPPRPLRAIASSGELARVMLALKTVLAAQDAVPVLVFDEVDANVGGETAVAVGQKMGRIGAQRQVLCITHLAQVAAAAPAHFVVTKDVREGRTLSQIERLGEKARVAELARMLGGGDAARKHAEALLKAR